MQRYFSNFKQEHLRFHNFHKKYVGIRHFLWHLRAEIRTLFTQKKSFSQSSEDLILKNLLGLGSSKKRGFYIDIGSGRPITHSNTYTLYRHGWHGILVDPIPLNRSLSRIIRPRDTFIHACVSDQSGISDFFELKDYSYSTTKREVADELIRNGTAKLIRHYRIPKITLSELFPLIPEDKTCILFIDAEGDDLTILESNDFDLFAPDIVVIECWKGYLKSMIRLMENQGYRLFARTINNLIFLK
jgi:hypothetical protein